MSNQIRPKSNSSSVLLSDLSFSKEQQLQIFIFFATLGFSASSAAPFTCMFTTFGSCLVQSDLQERSNQTQINVIHRRRKDRWMVVRFTASAHCSCTTIHVRKLRFWHSRQGPEKKNSAALKHHPVHYHFCFFWLNRITLTECPKRTGTFVLKGLSGRKRRWV